MPSEELAGKCDLSPSRRQGAPDQSHESRKLETHHVYDNVTAATSARLLNGDALSTDVKTPSPKHLYKNIRAEDQSSIWNGNVSSIVYFEKFFGPRHPLETREITQRGSVYWEVGKAV